MKKLRRKRKRRECAIKREELKEAGISKIKFLSKFRGSL